MIIDNKKAHFEYEILESIEAGIGLTGGEAKSFFENRVNLAGAYVKIIGSEMYLVNAKFTHNSVKPEQTSRSRKLLVHKREILAWGNKIRDKKLAIIPLSMYTRGRYVKLKIGLSKAKQEFNKKLKLKKLDLERETERDYRKKLD